MLPHFPTGAGTQEIGSKRKNEEKRNSLKENATKASLVNPSLPLVPEVLKQFFCHTWDELSAFSMSARTKITS